MPNPMYRTLLTVALGTAGGAMASIATGFAIAQFVVAGIDPQLADTYRSHYTQQVASVDDFGDGSSSDGARTEVAMLRDASYSPDMVDDRSTSADYDTP